LDVIDWYCGQLLLFIVGCYCWLTQLIIVKCYWTIIVIDIVIDGQLTDRLIDPLTQWPSWQPQYWLTNWYYWRTNPLLLDIIDYWWQWHWTGQLVDPVIVTQPDCWLRLIVDYWPIVGVGIIGWLLVNWYCWCELTQWCIIDWRTLLKASIVLTDSDPIDPVDGQLMTDPVGDYYYWLLVDPVTVLLIIVDSYWPIGYWQLLVFIVGQYWLLANYCWLLCDIIVIVGRWRTVTVTKACWAHWRWPWTVIIVIDDIVPIVIIDWRTQLVVDWPSYWLNLIIDPMTDDGWQWRYWTVDPIVDLLIIGIVEDWPHWSYWLLWAQLPRRNWPSEPRLDLEPRTRLTRRRPNWRMTQWPGPLTRTGQLLIEGGRGQLWTQLVTRLTQPMTRTTQLTLLWVGWRPNDGPASDWGQLAWPIVGPGRTDYYYWWPNCWCESGPSQLTIGQLTQLKTVIGWPDPVTVLWQLLLKFWPSWTDQWYWLNPVEVVIDC